MRAREILIPLVATGLVVGVMVHQARTVEPELCEAPAVRLGEIAGFKSEVVPPSEAELHTLPEDTIIDKRVYAAENGEWYQVSLVIGGRSKSSIHRPEMCLPSQGFQMMSPRTVSVGGVGWRVLSLARGGVSQLGFAYTFFNQSGFHTSSHVVRIFRDVWDRSILGRVDRWAMVTVNACCADDARISAFLRKLKEVVE